MSILTNPGKFNKETHLGSQVVEPSFPIFRRISISRPPSSLYMWMASTSYPSNEAKTVISVEVEHEAVDGRAGGM